MPREANAPGVPTHKLEGFNFVETSLCVEGDNPPADVLLAKTRPQTAREKIMGLFSPKKKAKAPEDVVLTKAQRASILKAIGVVDKADHEDDNPGVEASPSEGDPVVGMTLADLLPKILEVFSEEEAAFLLAKLGVDMGAPEAEKPEEVESAPSPVAMAKKALADAEAAEAADKDKDKGGTVGNADATTKAIMQLAESLEKSQTAMLDRFEKRMDKKDDRIEKLEQGNADAVAIAKAKEEYKNLAVDPKELGPLLARAEKALSKDDQEALGQLLRSANANLEALSVLQRQLGVSDGAGATDAYSDIVAEVDEGGGAAAAAEGTKKTAAKVHHIGGATEEQRQRTAKAVARITLLKKDRSVYNEDKKARGLKMGTRGD